MIPEKYDHKKFYSVGPGIWREDRKGTQKQFNETFNIWKVHNLDSFYWKTNQAGKAFEGLTL
jgi:hypothetical protein